MLPSPLPRKAGTYSCLYLPISVQQQLFTEACLW